MSRTATLVGGEVIASVHDPALCAGRPCAVHAPSDHHMRDWPQHFRDPLSEAATLGLHPGLIERVCEHGVGHPDPDHMAWYRSCHTPEESSAEATHGCDGCCVPLPDALAEALAFYLPGRATQRSAVGGEAFLLVHGDASDEDDWRALVDVMTEVDYPGLQLALVDLAT